MMQRKGFTLIEMLVVIAIIGILATLVLVGLGPVQRQGRDARRLSDLRQVENALSIYYNQHGAYPTAAAAGTWGALQNTLQAAVGASILQVQDPTPPPATYYYAVDGAGTTFVLGAKLEDQGNNAFKQSFTGTLPAGVSWTGTGPGGACGTAPLYCLTLS